MTDNELKNNGWDPHLCKIGILYFKGHYFCRLKEGFAILYTTSDDMHPIGAAYTLDELFELQKKSDLSDIQSMEVMLSTLKERFEETYGLSSDELS